ncbi:MAG: Cation-translocating P-type ATPase [Chthoniobacteraceae bacterium]|nr:Cation-translocating P-type ATPase [Chthoniobacteraceae bacterium]
MRALYVAGQSYDVTGEGYEPKGEVRFQGKAFVECHRALLLEHANILIGCNNAHLLQEEGVWKVIGDPTEGAILSAGHKAGGSKQQLDREMPVHHEIPFGSDRKRASEIRCLGDGRLLAFINGAPDLLLQRCTSLLTGTGIRPITGKDRLEIAAKNTALAAQALRVLGSAFRDLDSASPGLTADEIECDLVFVGLSGLYEPPRPEVREAVAKCGAAGIRVVMITGDHPHTAMAIAHDLGIASGAEVALSGIEVDKLTDDELREQTPHTAVFARVTAAHKLRIIRAWQANKAVVAMTGDGVNDAPAIKGADIGIAMGRSGTEVTKQASDIIITDDNFTSIVAAVEEGRGIYDNIRKTLQYPLAGNTGEVLLMTLCVVIGLPPPLLPIHLLWINLVTDGLPALCLATDPIHSDVMKQAPRHHQERITDRGFLGAMVLTGALTAAVSFAVYFYALNSAAPELARTYAFATLVFSELFRSFGARSEIRPVWQMNLFSNVNLVLVVAVSFSIQVWSHHNAYLAKLLKTSLIPASDCLILLIISAVPRLVLEVIKVLRQGRKASQLE